MKAKKNYNGKFVGLTPKEYEKLKDRHKKVLEIFSKYKFITYNQCWRIFV